MNATGQKIVEDREASCIRQRDVDRFRDDLANGTTITISERDERNEVLSKRAYKVVRKYPHICLLEARIHSNIVRTCLSYIELLQSGMQLGEVDEC